LENGVGDTPDKAHDDQTMSEMWRWERMFRMVAVEGMVDGPVLYLEGTD
jgi:hypothetical protein